MIEFADPASTALIELVQPFVFDDFDFDYEGITVSVSEPKMLENGILYSGEWSEEGMKHGKGVQTW
jgi:hypothetical protein